MKERTFSLSGLLHAKSAKDQVANRSDFAVIPVEGFNPKKVKEFSNGIEFTLGTTILKGVIFDRDYRSDQEIDKTQKELRKVCDIAHIHNRKEIENFLLEPLALTRAINRKIAEKRRRGETVLDFSEDISTIIGNLTEGLKNAILGQYLARRELYEKQQYPSYDHAAINALLLAEFDEIWSTFESRMRIVPGKQVLALLNKYLQEKYMVSLSVQVIISAFEKDEIPFDMKGLIEELDKFRMRKIGVEDV